MIGAQPALHVITHAALNTIHHDKSTLNVGRAGSAMRETVKVMDVERGLQHVREIQLTVGGTVESLLDFRGTPRRCLMFPLPTSWPSSPPLSRSLKRKV